MIVVHHLNNSRSQRVLWLLEELGVQYEIKLYEREKSGLAPASLRQVHPLGKSPVVTLEEGGVPLTLAESGAIIDYLVERFGVGRLAPPRGTPERLRYTYWIHFAEGSAMPPLLLKLVFDRVESGPMPFFIRPIAKAISAKVKAAFITPNIENTLSFMEAELSSRAWFAGDEFSACDIQLSFPIEAAAAGGALNESRPRLMGFLDRIHARPAYQRALQRGGPYALTR